MPAAPSNLTATAVSSSQINLAWNDNSNNEQGFRIERCQGNNCTNFVQIAQVGPNVTSFSNTGLREKQGLSISRAGIQWRRQFGLFQHCLSTNAAAITGVEMLFEVKRALRRPFFLFIVEEGRLASFADKVPLASLVIHHCASIQGCGDRMLVTEDRIEICDWLEPLFDRSRIVRTGADPFHGLKDSVDGCSDSNDDEEEKSHRRKGKHRR